MNTMMAMPSKELASRMLSPVAEENRLLGLRMHPMGGNRPCYLYTLPSAAEFLHTDTDERLLNPLSGAYIGYVDPGVLAEWIERVFGDEYLAMTVRDTFAASRSFSHAVEPLRELIVKRLDECAEVVGEHQPVE